MARKVREPLTTLAHHIDIDVLEQTYRRTRKNGAPSVNKITADIYAKRLQKRMQCLLERFKSGTYRGDRSRPTGTNRRHGHRHAGGAWLPRHALWLVGRV